jgi:hypothetical protein
MRFSCCFRIEKSKIRSETVSKAKKNAKMSKSISTKTVPFRLCQPESQLGNERARPAWASRLLAVAAIRTVLAGIAAVTLGVGRFGVIVELQQLLASILLSEGPENEVLA